MAVLTVIVVNWNGRQLLPECLSSLSNQSLKDVEVLLVDNGSTDDSVSLVRSQFPTVRILTLRENQGFAAGNNRGIQESFSEFVALLNNDAVADYCWAERLLDTASDSRVGIVASKVLLHSDHGRLDSAGDGMTTVGVGYKRGHLAPSNSYPSLDNVFGASGCAMLLRRSMLADVGLFDEDFFLLYEDSDLCFRAQLRGWRCLYAPNAIVYHKLNASIRKFSRAHVFYGQRNVEYLYFKDMPGWLVWKYLPIHLLNALLAFLYFGGKGHFSSYMKSKMDFLRNMRRVLRKRQEIQAGRTISCRDMNRILDRRWLRVRLPGK
jgi:hypothetical protein